MAKKKARSATHSTIPQHRRQGSALVPPLRTLPQLKPVSWHNDRLPEILWAALLITHLPRRAALTTFYRVGDYVHRNREIEMIHDVTHTGTSRLSHEIAAGLVATIVESAEHREALAPLLVLRELPGRELWEQALGATNAEDWNSLALAIARTLDHQSQEATDCRWLRVVGLLAAGKLHLQNEEQAKQLSGYPDYGDQRQVRPFIRATEGMLDQANDSGREWPARFWAQCLTDTACYPLTMGRDSIPLILGTTPDRARFVYDRLVEHCAATRATSATDARHDTVFGIALYSLGLLQELLRVGASQSITGRLALRTIGECAITLAYLAYKDSPELWMSYRVYGAGQAKLAFLKLEEAEDQPTYVNIEMLEHLANEDMWQEFLPIELGHWDKTNLRKMSEEAGVKTEYDRFYSWTSTFSHGHWGATRDTVFDTCGNPLHRVHRIPASAPHTLPDAVPDACTYVDHILALVSRCYPDFAERVAMTTAQ